MKERKEKKGKIIYKRKENLGRKLRRKSKEKKGRGEGGIKEPEKRGRYI